MNKDEIKNTVNDPGMLSGIYNYCDRWCERCSLTANCAVFAIEQAHAGEPGARDLENQAFWEQLQGTFATTMELIRELAEEAGVNLDVLPLASDEVEEARVDDQTAESPLVSAAMWYLMVVHRWLESTDKLFQEKVDEIGVKARFGLLGAYPDAEVVDLQDIIQVVRWYHTLIPVKIKRAVRQELRGRPVSLADLPTDSDGSAKVALIAIDRSMAAWSRLRAHFLNAENDIHNFLIYLERLRQGTERQFPHARAFVRPGFDEEVTGFEANK